VSQSNAPLRTTFTHRTLEFNTKASDQTFVVDKLTLQFILQFIIEPNSPASVAVHKV